MPYERVTGLVSSLSGEGGEGMTRLAAVGTVLVWSVVYTTLHININFNGYLRREEQRHVSWQPVWKTLQDNHSRPHLNVGTFVLGAT